MYHSKGSADTMTPVAGCHCDLCKPITDLFHSPAFVSGVASIVLLTSLSGCAKITTDKMVWDNMSLVTPFNDNKSGGACLNDDGPTSSNCR